MNFVKAFLNWIKDFFISKILNIDDLDKKIPFLIESSLKDTEIKYFYMNYIGDTWNHIKELFHKDLDILDYYGSDFVVDKIVNELHGYFRELLSQEDNHSKSNELFLLADNEKYDFFNVYININEKTKICIYWKMTDLTNQWLAYHGREPLPTDIDQDDIELKKKISFKLRSTIQSQKTKLEDWYQSLYN